MDFRTLKALIESYINEENINTLNRTYGVEFEMCFKRDAIAEYINNNPEFADDSSALFWGETEAWDQVLQKEGFGNWEVHQDSSVTGNYSSKTYERDPGIEIVTPILSGEAGLQEIKRFLNVFVSKLGGYVNDSCGGHIHIGAADLLQGSEKQVANKFILGLLTAEKFAPLLNALVPRERRDSEWAQHVSVYGPDAAKALSKAKDYEATKHTAQTLVNMFASDRYKSINFKSLATKGTIEFRIFEGNLNYQTIEQRVRFGNAFVNLLAEVEVDLLPNLKTMKQQMQDVTKKGPRSQDTKAILRNIIRQNLSEQRYVLNHLHTAEGRLYLNPHNTVYAALVQAFTNYPLYKKPVNLLDHRVIIDMRSSSKVEVALKILKEASMRDVYTMDTKIHVLPIVYADDYEEKLSNLVVSSAVGEELTAKAISPEDFLKKFDVAEAAPYIAKFEEYKKDIDKAKAARASEEDIAF